MRGVDTATPDTSPSKSFLAGVRPHQGQSLVELAVLIPILLLLVLGSIDLGRIFFAHIAIKNAAREGAQDLALSHQSYDFSTAAGRTVMRNAVFQRVVTETAKTLDLGANNSLITVSVAPPITPTDRVSVTVVYSFTLLFLAPVTQLLADWWGGPALRQTNPMTYTSGFPIITGALASTCTGGGLLAQPSTIPVSEFPTTTVVLTYTNFTADPVAFNWDTKDGSAPGQPIVGTLDLSRSTYTFVGSAIDASRQTIGSHYAYAYQAATNRCAAAVITLTCASKTLPIETGSVEIPGATGKYYIFSSDQSIGSVSATGLFPSTADFTRIEIYKGRPFGNISGSQVTPLERLNRSGDLLNSVSDTAEGRRTASYNIPGTAFTGGDFTVLLFNETVGTITVGDTAATACNIFAR